MGFEFPFGVNQSIFFKMIRYADLIRLLPSATSRSAWNLSPQPVGNSARSLHYRFYGVFRCAIFNRRVITATVITRNSDAPISYGQEVDN